MVTDGAGTPLAIEVTAGQVNESTRFESVVATFIASRKHRRRRKPRKLAGDKGYSVKRIRDWLKATGIEIVILPDHYDYDSVVRKIEAVGKATGKVAEANALVAQGRADMKARGWS